MIAGVSVISLIIKIFSSKWTYIILFVATIVITCAIFVNRVNAYKEKIESLGETIDNLENTNSLLTKENLYQREAMNSLISYSNSTLIIDKLNAVQLAEENKYAINAISNDFYMYFERRLPND